MSIESLADGAGFLGALVILSGFAWHTVRGVAPDLIYHLCNLIGASLLAASLMINFNLPALCLEVAWAAIALFGLVRMMRARPS
jgi:hypothetical protein